MSQSTRSPRSRKAVTPPKKPYPEFPLSAHPGGKWQKKIQGKIHYFGRWSRHVDGKLVRVEKDGWEEALRLYKEQADDLYAGREPSVKKEGINVAELCSEFLTAKTRKMQSGELGARMYRDYEEIATLLMEELGNTRKVIGLSAEDFGKLRATMAKRWGPTRMRNAITRVKSVFKFGFDNGLLDRPMRYGTEFKKPDKSVLRRHRGKKPVKMIDAADLRKLMDAADPTMKAMILLGLNAGMGNMDCASLPKSALNLTSGWIDYPRPKTGIARRAPLWPETVAAIRQALDVRHVAKQEEHGELVFLSERGTQVVRAVKTARVDLVAIQFGKLLKKLGLHREGVGFYTLRHILRTVADATRDPVAIDSIMGHADPSMAAHNRERIDDDRLKAVVDHVHLWLYGEKVQG
jgi:integrase